MDQGVQTFLVDCMLGRLATWLRLLGLDAPLRHRPPARVAPGQVLITRRTRLKGRPGVLFISHDRLGDQLRQVVDSLRLTLEPKRFFTRCLRCNVAVRPLSREQAGELVPRYTLHTAERFTRCPACGRVYWPGSHTKRAGDVLRAIDPLYLNREKTT